MMVKKKHKGCMTLSLLAAVLMLCVGCSPNSPSAGSTALNGQGSSQTVQKDESAALNETQESGPTDVAVKTRWLDLVIPGNCAASITHREVVEGGIAMEIFSMDTAEGERELFRIYFGDEETGTFLGTLHEEGSKIPVTLSVTEYRESDFPDDRTRELYYRAMDGMNRILNGLYSDERFSSEEKTVIDVEEKHLSYWDFSLPVGMDFEESWEDDAYRAVFYGTVDGTQYPLYTVAVGGKPLSTVLGSYSADGQQETVSVESFELPDTEGWPEDSEMELYKMMETINEVIQIIMESKGFSAAAA